MPGEDEVDARVFPSSKMVVDVTSSDPLQLVLSKTCLDVLTNLGKVRPRTSPLDLLSVCSFFACLSTCQLSAACMSCLFLSQLLLMEDVIPHFSRTELERPLSCIE